MGRRTSSKTTLTPLELRVMQVLWDQGQCPVLDVQQKLPGELAYTTVQTVLNTLARKEFAAKIPNGKAYEYKALVSRERTLRSALTEFIDRVFLGSTKELVMNLADSRKIDERLLKELSARLKK